MTAGTNKKSGAWTAGIDLGSTAIKVVLYDGSRYVTGIAPTGWNPKQAADELLAEVIACTGLPEVPPIATTGYGRRCMDSEVTSTEIACHARGAAFLVPGCRFVIDIGGQDAKGIRLTADGRVEDFVMNDKCAAGTGRFLSAMAAALGMDVDELSGYAEGAEPHRINSMCTVFAESEVIGLINQGISRASIIAGLDASIARRTASMVGGLHPQPPIAFTGGVARNTDIVKKLEEALGQPVIVPRDGIFAGALGAALICREQVAGEESCGL